MPNFAEYLAKPTTQDEYKHFLIGMLIHQYAEMGEQIPRFSINNGKLETDSQELRLKYRYMLQGAQAFAVLLDQLDARRKQQAAAAQQQNQK